MSGDQRYGWVWKVEDCGKQLFAGQRPKHFSGRVFEDALGRIHRLKNICLSLAHQGLRPMLQGQLQLFQLSITSSVLLLNVQYRRIFHRFLAVLQHPRSQDRILIVSHGMLWSILGRTARSAGFLALFAL
jgi:hypothetical protein